MEPDTPTPSVLNFIRAALHQWVALMSGGIVTVALGVFERLSGRNVPLWVYIGVLVFFAFSACYMAWREARRQLIDLAQEMADASMRQEVADGLSMLLLDGRVLLTACEREDQPLPDGPIKKWLEDASDFLTARMGKSYHLQFICCVERLPPGYTYTSQTHRRHYGNIYARLQMLEEFISDVREGRITLPKRSAPPEVRTLTG